MSLESIASRESSLLPNVRARRRRREKQARRQSILDAAGAVFLKRGISAATMEQVAERAELSKGAVYLYFHSKQELGLAVLLEASRRLVAMLKAVHDPTAPPFQELERLMDAYYRFHLREPDYFRLLFVMEHQSYRGDVGEELQTEWTRLGKEAFELVAATIERGINQGSIRRCDPWMTAVSLWASVTGVIVLPAQEIRSTFVGHLSEEALVRFTVQNFFRGLEAGAPVGEQSTNSREQSS
jgi:AcrR family transcriptional regulator